MLARFQEDWDGDSTCDQRSLGGAIVRWTTPLALGSTHHDNDQRPRGKRLQDRALGAFLHNPVAPKQGRRWPKAAGPVHRPHGLATPRRLLLHGAQRSSNGFQHRATSGSGRYARSDVRVEHYTVEPTVTPPRSCDKWPRQSPGLHLPPSRRDGNHGEGAGLRGRQQGSRQFRRPRHPQRRGRPGRTGHQRDRRDAAPMAAG